MNLYVVNKPICNAYYKKVCDNKKMINKYSERLNYALEKREMSQSELARRVGVKPQAIQYLCREGTKSVHSVKIAEILNINAKWLTDGVGDMEALESIGEINPPNYLLGEFDLWDSSTPLSDDEVALPFFREVELSAGPGRHEVIENHYYKLRFAKSTLKKHGVQADKAACVTVSGKSMEPVYPDGCTVGIDTSKNTLIDADIFAIDHDGELRVKTLYKLPGGGIRLRSFNIDEYPDENYSAEEAAKIRILGRVFWWSALR